MIVKKSSYSLNKSVSSNKYEEVIRNDEKLEKVNSNLKIQLSNKRKSVLENIENINNTLWSRFKLTKVDLDEIEKSKILKLGDWNRIPTSELLVKIKKEQRRKEYWNRRMNI